MKRLLFAIFVASSGVVGFMSTGTSDSRERFSQLNIENIEALSDNEGGLGTGSPCYNSGEYDSHYPEAVVCGNPCFYQFHNPGWLRSTSKCP